MRQVADTLVWLALIAVVVAVLYLTPVVAQYVSSRDPGPPHPGEHGGVAWRVPDDGIDEPVEELR